VTPARYVTAIICEHGIAREPYQQSLAALAAKAAHAAYRIILMMKMQKLASLVMAVAALGVGQGSPDGALRASRCR